MFRKGQKVTHISRWNNLGDFTYRDAIVYSCGKVRMVLTDANTGEEVGRNFNPDGNTYGVITIPQISNEEVFVMVTEMAKEWREKEEARLRHCLTIDASDSYKKAIQTQLDDLLSHVPVIMTHQEAQEIVKNKVKKRLGQG